MGRNTGNLVSEGLTHLLKQFLVKENCARVQELCESRGGRPGLSVPTSLMVSVDVKQY